MDQIRLDDTVFKVETQTEREMPQKKKKSHFLEGKKRFNLYVTDQLCTGLKQCEMSVDLLVKVETDLGVYVTRQMEGFQFDQINPNEGK